MQSRHVSLLGLVGLLGLLGCGAKETKTEGAGRVIAFPGGGTSDGGAGATGAGVSAEKPSATSGTITQANAATVKKSVEGLLEASNPFKLKAEDVFSGSPGTAPLSTSTPSSTSASPTATSLTSTPSLFAMLSDGLDLGAPSAPTCATMSGDSTDADSDGWLKNAVLTYNCANLSATSASTKDKDGDKSNLTFKITGSFEIADDDDSKKFPDAGFSVTYNNFAFDISGSASTGSAGTGTDSGTTPVSVKTTLNGGQKVAVLDGAITMDFSMKSTFETAGKWGSVGQWFNSKLTPTDKTKPTEGGALELSGFFSATDASDGSNNYILKFASQNLKYGCTNGKYKSGTVTVEAGSGEIVFTYADCNVTTKFNDTDI